jgi:hypothetical protein
MLEIFPEFKMQFNFKIFSSQNFIKVCNFKWVIKQKRENKIKSKT